MVHGEEFIEIAVKWETNCRKQEKKHCKIIFTYTLLIQIKIVKYLFLICLMGNMDYF